VLVKCSPNPVTAGAISLCKVDMNGAPAESVWIKVTSSAPAVVRVTTSAIQVKPDMNYARFVAYTQTGVVSPAVTLTATFGGASTSTTIQVIGEATTSETDLKLSAAETQDVVVRRAAAASEGKPVAIHNLANAASLVRDNACSPGSAATITGTGFSEETYVTVNGNAVPVLSAGKTNVTFQCPDDPAGTPLNIAAHTSAGSAVRQAIMQEVTPGVFTMNGKGAGYASVTFSGTVDLAVPGMRDVYGIAAKPRDVVSIYCTGLGRTFGSSSSPVKPVVLVSGISAEVTEATYIGDGVYQVDIRIPDAVGSGAAPLEVRMPTAGAATADSNRVIISLQR
jgi:uncharacterized protein (TIGR03437 family)